MGFIAKDPLSKNYILRQLQMIGKKRAISMHPFNISLNRL
jgi:hypothetical protein